MVENIPRSEVEQYFSQVKRNDLKLSHMAHFLENNMIIL